MNNTATRPQLTIHAPDPANFYHQGEVIIPLQSSLADHKIDALTSGITSDNSFPASSDYISSAGEHLSSLLERTRVNE
jgi:hypothetical protein